MNWALPLSDAFRTVRRPRQQLTRLYQDALARSSGYILATTAATSVLGFAYWVLAARAYPAAAVGYGAVSVSVMTLTSLLSGLGTTAAPIQRIPQRLRGREWNLTVSVGLVVGTGAGLVAGLIGWAVLLLVIHSQPLHSLGYCLVLAIGVGFYNCSQVLDSIWVVERAAQIRLLTNTVMSVVKLPLLLLPSVRILGAVGIQLTWTVGFGVAVLLSLLLLARERGLRLELSSFWQEFRAMAESLTGNFIVNVGTNVPTYAVPVVVGAVVTASSTAYFYSAWRVGTLFFLATAAVTTALFAEGSRAPQEAIRKAQQATFALVPVLLLVTAGLVVVGPWILEAFGDQYRIHAFPLLLFLVGATVPDALTAVYRTVLRLQGRYFQASCFMWGLAILQIGLTWLLLPVWGITGAGAAWFFAQSLGLVVSLVDRAFGPYRGGQLTVPAAGSRGPIGGA